jgi:hypothetical protein
MGMALKVTFTLDDETIARLHVVLEAMTVPDPLVQIENTSRLFSKMRISG